MNIGPPTADEFPLIIDAWARSFRKSPWAGCVPNHLYPSVSRACIGEILNRPGTRVLVATVDIQNLDNPTRRVLGYSVSEPDRKLLHWLFVKDDYRGAGLQIGTQLLTATCPGDDPWTYTHRTRASARFLGPRFTWDPTPARLK